MTTMNCVQLTKFYSSYVVDNNLWICMEYLEAGSLLDILKENGPLQEEYIAFIMKELLTALEYLHAKKKIHRDVKAGNLLVGRDGSIKLADFGVTGQLTESMDKRKTQIGTPFWMAPEVITQTNYDGCADIWSTGITAIELAKGAPPYANKIHPFQVIFLIPKSPPPKLESTNSTQFTQTFQNFVASCLQKDPSTRPSATDLLLHPFVSTASRTDQWCTFIYDSVIVPNELAQKQHLIELEESSVYTGTRSDDVDEEHKGREGEGKQSTEYDDHSGACSVNKDIMEEDSLDIDSIIARSSSDNSACMNNTSINRFTPSTTPSTTPSRKIIAGSSVLCPTPERSPNASMQSSPISFSFARRGPSPHTLSPRTLTSKISVYDQSVYDDSVFDDAPTKQPPPTALRHSSSTFNSSSSSRSSTPANPNSFLPAKTSAFQSIGSIVGPLSASSLEAIDNTTTIPRNFSFQSLSHCDSSDVRGRMSPHRLPNMPRATSNNMGSSPYASPKRTLSPSSFSFSSFNLPLFPKEGLHRAAKKGEEIQRLTLEVKRLQQVR